MKKLKSFIIKNPTKKIIGDKRKFAVELKFNEFFDDNFIAYGSFRIYINNYAYGIDRDYSTLYSSIEIYLRQIIEENIIVKNIFTEYSDYEIAYKYAITNRDDDLTGNVYLGMNRNSLESYIYSFGELYESAFDNGCNIIMFREEASVKLIGYELLDDYTIENLNSVILQKEEFDNIIKESYKLINSERDMYLLNL